MPIVAHNSLPSFADLRAAGESVLTTTEAVKQDIRELHIGLLNMMPDAALRATERQFMTLIGSANPIVQLYIHPFTVDGPKRGNAAQEYIDAHYETFDDVRAVGLDALVVTGANPVTDSLEDESFYYPLAEAMDWAQESVTSTLCSCLSSHAILQHVYDIKRRPLSAKRWGVFPHRNVVANHPLLRGMNTRYDAPHSRWNAITTTQLEAAGLRVLAESFEGDVHIATSADGFRNIYLQGHPEYDTVSLLKEFKREVMRYLDGEIAQPPLPANYMRPAGVRRVGAYFEELRTNPNAPFPEADLLQYVDNTWTDTAKALFNNWLGLVYQLTGYNRTTPFMEGVDPQDPLGLDRQND